MKKYFLLLGTIMILFMAHPMEAFALGDAATLWVSDNNFVWAGEVKQTVASDGKGGTAVYNVQNNTLTLNNYCPNGDDGPGIQISGMGNDFQIILKGVNKLSSNKSEAIWGTDNSFILNGPGKLITNAGITTPAETDYKLIIKNCQLEITSPNGGILCGTLEIQNADITVLSKAQLLRYFGIEAESLIVKNANITTSIISPGHLSLLVNRDKDDGTIVSESEKIILLGNEKIVDENNNLLHTEEFSYNSKMWYVFTSKTHEEFLADKQNSIAKTVRIVSDERSAITNQVKEVIRLIDAIGTVTQNSGAAISQAKTAYLALTEYQKEMVYNYSALTEADKKYQEINQAAADKVIALIEKIGNVTTKSRNAIELAEQEYAKLTDEQKAKVNNYGALSQAKAQYITIFQNEKVKEDKENTSTQKVSVKKAVFRKVTSKKKKKATLTWKADKKCTGYQIQYSTDKKFKKKVVAKYVKSYKKTSITIKNLKSKTKYYFRIREYKTVNGKKYFGKWSSIKKCSIK